MKLTVLSKCLICEKECKKTNKLSIHIKQEHNITPKDYYDTFYRQPNEGICPGCDKETIFYKFSHGYKKYCSIQCGKDIINEKRKNFYRLKYQDENIVNNTCVPGVVEIMWKNYEQRTGYRHNMCTINMVKNL